MAWDGSEFKVHKVLSTPRDPSIAILKGLEEMKFDGKADIVHGSTIATNTILERKGARVALVITEQFKDVLEIGRQNRGSLYNLGWEKPEQLISFKLPVRERLDSKGRVLEPLDVKALQRLKKRLARAESIAICFLHSYRNNIHERKAERILELLRLPISCSSDVCPEYREYERFSTTVINAYVSPVMGKYLKKLKGLSGGSLRIVSSAGGSLSIDKVSERAVETVLSGPCAGAVAARELILHMGLDKAISFDMGGTSTDVCLVQREFRLTKEAKFAGFPVRVPMIDINSIGAGGGSICWIDDGGALRVGPQSAGSSPGPACYSLGGTLPTITDVNLILADTP